ncbi:MAG: hypothetical protein FJ150_08585 [Euryarchaeota archaeon]|nr:hypothetical protein [Euryarchaeota archaeon]
MKIPDKIKINGKTFTIEMRNNRATNDGVDVGASSCLWSQKIWIDNDQHIESQEEGLLHEILEVVSKEMGFELNHTTITALSNILYQVLKDNNLLER